MAFIAIVFIIILIFKICALLFPEHLIQLDDVQWKKVRKKDYFQLFVAFSALLLAESFYPSLEGTGRKTIVVDNQYEFNKAPLKRRDSSLAYEKFAELAPWLSEFSQAAFHKREKRILALSQELKKLKEDVLLNAQKISTLQIAESSFKQKYKDILNKERTNEENEKYKDILRRESIFRDKSEDLFSISRKVRAAFFKRNTEEELLKLHQNVFDMNNTAFGIDRDIPVLYVDKKVRFSSLSNYEREYHSDTKEIAREIDQSIYLNQFVSKIKSFILHLTARNRPEAEGQRRLHCKVSLHIGDDQSTAERFCELAVPIPIDYDLTNADCYLTLFKNSSDENIEQEANCLERWVAPPIKLRIYEDRMVIYEPIALDKEFHLVSKANSSRWVIQIKDKHIPIVGETTIKLPQDIADLKKLKLRHMAINNNTRIWDNIDSELSWVGSRKEQLVGDAYAKFNHFSGQSYQLNIEDELRLISQFLDISSPSLPIKNFVATDDLMKNNLAGVLNKLKRSRGLELRECYFNRFSFDRWYIDVNKTLPQIAIKLNKEDISLVFAEPNSSQVECYKVAIVDALTENFMMRYLSNNRQKK